MRKRSETIVIRRYLVWSALLAGIAAIVYMFVALVPLWQFRRNAPVKLPVGAGAPHSAYHDGVVFASDQFVVYFNHRGKRMFAYAMPDVRLMSAYGDRLALATGNQVFMLSRSGRLTLAPRPFSEPIQALRLGKGYIAVLTKDEAQRNKVTILDYYGALLDEIVLPGQSVMDMGFMGDKSSVWILTLDATGAIPVSRCSIYVPREEHSTSIAGSDQVFYRALPTDEYLYMVGTSGLLCYNNVNELRGEKTIYGWRLLPGGIGRQRVLLANVGVDQEPAGHPLERGRVLELKVSSAGDTEFLFPSGTLHAAIGENAVFAATGDTLWRLGFDGSAKGSAPLPIPIDGLELIGRGKSLLVRSGEELYIHPLP